MENEKSAIPRSHIKSLRKRVSFSEEILVYLVDERKEYTDYRKRYWENFAIDRIRFQDRVRELELILAPLLKNRIFS